VYCDGYVEEGSASDFAVGSLDVSGARTTNTYMAGSQLRKRTSMAVCLSSLTSEGSSGPQSLERATAACMLMGVSLSRTRSMSAALSDVLAIKS
jgi:hypothetical protein